MQEFCFYFKGERITNCDTDYLIELYKGIENAEEIIEGIKESEMRFKSGE